MINLSWSINGNLPDSGGNVDHPDWLIVSAKLNAVLGSAGSVGLETEDDNEKIRSLSVKAESGAYLLTFGVETSEGWTVRTYKNPNVAAPGQLVEILGDRWNTQAICSDEQLVIRVFEEFFETGDVASENLA